MVVERKVDFCPSEKQYLAWTALEDNITEEVVYGGAAGGGKSYMGCHWKVYRRMRYPDSRGITGRATRTSLEESTIITFFKVLGEWGMKEGRDYWYNRTKLYIQFANGSREVFRDLSYEPSDPEYTRLGSSEYTDAWIEEDFNSIPEKAAEILKSRVRWKLSDYGLVPKILLTCNPGYHWLRDKYFFDESENPRLLKYYQQVIQALVTDNPDKEFVRIYKASLEKLNEYDRQRLLEGNWCATEKTGAEFYHAFNSEKHLRDLSRIYNPEHPLHITLDFNTAPYMTLNIWQVWGPDARQLGEICPDGKDANTIATAKRFIASKFGKHKAEILVYGDPAGKHEDTRNEEGQNDYKLLFKELRKAGLILSDRVESKAPSVSMRGQFINEIFTNNYGGISLEIDKTCKNTVADYLYVKKAADGTKEKKKVEDPKTKVRCEKYGHTSDANDYFLVRIFKPEYTKFISRSTATPVIVKRQELRRAI